MLHRVNKGEKIKTADINQFTDAVAAKFPGDSGMATASRSVLKGDQESQTCFAMNVGAVTLLPYEIAAIRGQVYTGVKPEENRGFIPTIDVAADTDVLSSFVVCEERIAPGQLGRVICSGFAAAKANIGSGIYGSLIAGQVALTLNSTGGPAHIIDGAGTELVIIRFPIGGGGVATVVDSGFGWIFWGGW